MNPCENTRAARQSRDACLSEEQRALHTPAPTYATIR